MAHHECCVPGCKSRASQDKTFHIFPQTGERKRQWLHHLKLDETGSFQVTSETRICPKHFTHDDYRLVKDAKGRSTQEKVLKENACPSVFPWSKEKKERKTSVSKACRKRESLDENDALIDDVPPKKRCRSTKKSAELTENAATADEAKEGANETTIEGKETGASSTSKEAEVGPTEEETPVEIFSEVFQDSAAEVVSSIESDYVIVEAEDCIVPDVTCKEDGLLDVNPQVGQVADELEGIPREVEVPTVVDATMPLPLTVN